MKRISVLIAAALFTIMSGSSSAQDQDWEVLFDGKTLDNWKGDPRLWSVEDGAITGRTTPETKLKSNSFLVYEGGELDNFELELEYGQAISTTVHSKSDWEGKLSLTPLYHNISQEGIRI